jgi:biotin/methionine sulfoxide reductase
MTTRTIQTASHWGVYNVTTDDDGRILQTSPLQDDPHPATFCDGLCDIVHSELRIDRPYVRRGFLRHRETSRHLRGNDHFVAVSWDEALSLVAQEIKRVTTAFGNESIYGGSYGWASAGRLHHSPSVLKRFLGMNGGYVDKLGNHSFGAALHIMPYVIGRADIPRQAMPWPLIVAHTRLLVMFGGAHRKNSQIDSGGTVLHETRGWIDKARDAGIELVTISPSRDDAADSAIGRWISIRPNTDVALMLGLAHTLATEGLHSLDFLTRYCVGYSRFESYLLGATDGQPKDAEWAAAITQVDAQTIRDLARRMAGTRTLMTTSWSVQRADHGEQPIWMSVVLAAMLGQIGLPGGGFSFGLGAISGIAMPQPDNLPRPTLPLGTNPITNHVPVGRVAEMLLNPGSELDYNGRRIRLPHIKLIYSAGGNPFHHNTNLNRFVRAWQQPDTVIVHEPWWAPPAKYADIVLPATTTLERNDIQASELSRFYIAMRQVVPPFASSRNDMDIFAELADRLGFGEAYTEGRDEMGWLAHMYDGARNRARELGYSLPGFDEFWQSGSYEFPAPVECASFLGAFRRDPELNRLSTPSGKIEIFSAAIERFDYDDCPPHPRWLEPAEWLGSKTAARFPLHLLSNQPSVRLHSQLDPSRLSIASKISGREPLRMSAADAKDRGLGSGDTVRVFNDRGSFIAAVQVVDHLTPGVIQIATGAWYDPAQPGLPASLEKHGNPNVVTDDKGTSRLGQSSAAQTVLVEVERISTPPELTAFDRPAIELKHDAARGPACVI